MVEFLPNHKEGNETVTHDDREAENLGEEYAVNVLTDYFRRTSRGRIIDLPRWAQ
jgi:hypothetical protein